MSSTPAAPPPRPLNPLVILALAIVLPGSGQVFNKEPYRGLMFLFFMLLLGGFTKSSCSTGSTMCTGSG